MTNPCRFIGLTPDQLLSLYVRAKSLYYYGAKEQSPLTDAEYDELELQVRQHFPGHKALVAGAPVPLDSPLEKRQHRIFMGSIANSMTPEQAKQWWESHGSRPVVVALKVDGLSLDLQYDDGLLTHAITRGDTDTGIGEDVTHNGVLVDGIHSATRGINNVRGEVVLTSLGWVKLREKYPDYKTARNLAAGMIRRKAIDPECGEMTFYAHWLHPSDEASPANHSYAAALESLRVAGFRVPLFWLCSTWEEIESVHRTIEESRRTYPYEIDGAVITIDDLAYWREKGIDSENCPRAQTAWKFTSESAVTKLLSVEVNVSQHGKLCPVAILEPVQLGGVTVSRATLNNYQFIEDLGVQIGDRVKVARQGDVIPNVIGVDDTDGERDPEERIIEPIACPVCGGDVKRAVLADGKEGAESYCQNADCDAKTLGKLKRWADTHRMKGFGPEIREALTKVRIEREGDEEIKMVVHTGDGPIEDALVQTVADLFKLRNWPLTVLADIPMGKGTRIGVKRMKSVLDEIEKTKLVSIERFIDGLGVKGLGERKVSQIREAWKSLKGISTHHPSTFDTPAGWFTEGEDSALTRYARELGIPGQAEAFQRGLDARRSLADELLALGVTIQTSEPAAAPEAVSGGLAGKVFCLTGDFPVKKAVIEEEIRAAGGGTEDDVRKNVTHVVMSEVPPDDKLTGKGQKARKKGLPLISLSELQQMLKGAEPMKAEPEPVPAAPAPYVQSKYDDDYCDGYPE